MAVTATTQNDEFLLFSIPEKLVRKIQFVNTSKHVQDCKFLSTICNTCNKFLSFHFLVEYKMERCTDISCVDVPA